MNSYSLRSVSGRLFGLVAILSFTVLIVTRNHALFTNPVPWAEEASLYLSVATRDTVFDVLFLTQLQGYYQAVVSVTAKLAGAVSLDLAPYVFLYAALAFHVASIGIVIIARPSYARRPAHAVLLCALIVFILPFDEVWLNSTNTHFVMAVIAFLILMDFNERTSRTKHFAYISFVALACLSGPPACLLAPAFLAKFLYMRTFGPEALAALVPTVLQTFLMLMNSGSSQVETDPGDLLTVVHYAGAVAATKSIVLPLVGTEYSQHVADRLIQWPFLGWMICAATMGPLFYLGIRNAGFQAVLVLIAFIFTHFASLLSFQGSAERMIGASYGNRYFYSINIYLYFVVFLIACSSPMGSGIRLSAVRVVAQLLLFGAIVQGLFNHVPQQGRGNIDWSQEVRAWRAGERPCGLEIAPAGWSVVIQDQRTIQAIQEALRQRGAGDVLPTGRVDDATLSAIRHHRERMGLQPGTHIGRRLLESLSLCAGQPAGG